MKRTKKENLSSAGTSLSWLDNLQEAITERNGVKSIEEYETEGWRTMKQILESMKDSGNVIGPIRIGRIIRKQIDDGKMEKIDVRVPNETGKKIRRVFYRGK